MNIMSLCNLAAHATAGYSLTGVHVVCAHYGFHLLEAEEMGELSLMIEEVRKLCEILPLLPPRNRPYYFVKEREA